MCRCMCMPGRIGYVPLARCATGVQRSAPEYSGLLLLTFRSPNGLANAGPSVRERVVLRSLLLRPDGRGRDGRRVGLQ